MVLGFLDSFANECTYVYVRVDILTVMHVIDSFVGPSVGMGPSPTVVRTAPRTRLTFHLTGYSHM
jgi:hypothetical protein